MVKGRIMLIFMFMLQNCIWNYAIFTSEEDLIGHLIWSLGFAKVTQSVEALRLENIM